MKTILIDTNIILDVLTGREPHAHSSRQVWIAIETGLARGLVAAHAVTTVEYLIHSHLGRARARRSIATMLTVFGVAPVDKTVLDQALELEMADFEDAVTAAAAHYAGCHWLVTRDLRGFRNSPVRSFTPEAALPLLKGESPAP
jgi:predicted nucleic acid-binding protein